MGVGFGISIKAVGVPEHGRSRPERYSVEYEHIEEEWKSEATAYHERQPYAILLGLLFLPCGACDDGTPRSAFARAVDQFRNLAGRRHPQDPACLVEKIHVGLYESDPPNAGRVRFFDVEQSTPPQGGPSEAHVRTFEQYVESIAELFKGRNPKIRIRARNAATTLRRDTRTTP
jgi:hypothetical protein